MRNMSGVSQWWARLHVWRGPVPLTVHCLNRATPTTYSADVEKPSIVNFTTSKARLERRPGDPARPA